MARAWRTTLRLTLMAKLRGRGPKVTPPPVRIGDLTLPARARPVPFWRYSLAVEPETSPRVLDDAVPRRRAACSARTTRCSVLTSAGTANRSLLRSRVSISLPAASTTVATPSLPWRGSARGLLLGLDLGEDARRGAASATGFGCGGRLLGGRLGGGLGLRRARLLGGRLGGGLLGGRLGGGGFFGGRLRRPAFLAAGFLAAGLAAAFLAAGFLASPRRPWPAACSGAAAASTSGVFLISSALTATYP